MDKYLRLAVAAALSWIGLSAYRTDGQQMWVGWSGPDILEKALVALAAFQIAPYIPNLGVAAGGARSAAGDLLLRAIMVGGPAFAAMTAMAASRGQVPDWHVGTAAGGLVASWMAWKQLGGRPVGSPASVAGQGGPARPGAAELQQAIATLARGSGMPAPAANQEVRLRYVAADGSRQFLDVPTHLG